LKSGATGECCRGVARLGVRVPALPLPTSHARAARPCPALRLIPASLYETGPIGWTRSLSAPLLHVFALKKEKSRHFEAAPLCV